MVSVVSPPYKSRKDPSGVMRSCRITPGFPPYLPSA